MRNKGMDFIKNFVFDLKDFRYMVELKILVSLLDSFRL